VTPEAHDELRAQSGEHRGPGLIANDGEKSHDHTMLHNVRASARQRPALFASMLVVLLALLTLGADTPKTAAPARKPATRVLFIGNSYTSVNDLPAIVRAIGRAAKPPVEIAIESITPGAFTLEGHFATEGEHSPRARIAAGAFDFVVMQEQSQRPILEPAKMLEAARAFGKELAAAKATPVWYATWARKAKPTQQDALDKAYADCHASVGGRLAPVGAAWKLVASAKESKDRIELYDADESHPSPAGSYLAGLVLYATITGNSIDGMPPRLTEPAAKGPERVLVELEPREAKLLQKAAAKALEAEQPAKR
jgi:hypothetical protein